MSISSSLNAGVSGLFANSTRLATIADNIANSATHGYKRADVAFNSLVIGQGALTGSHTAGGVRASTFRAVEQHGPLITTNHPLDVAVGGRGMLPVVPLESMDQPPGNRPLTMTTTGSFRLDKDGVLRTESGLVLLGWPANADGSFTEPVRDNATSLQPITVNAAQASADPTTRIALGVNLPATATDAGAVGDPIPFSIEYFGNLGTAETLTVDFQPALGHATGKSNEWVMTIRDSATADPLAPVTGAAIAEYSISFDDSMAAGGTIAAVTPVIGTGYDPATGSIELAVGGGVIDLQIGRPGDHSGLTQVGDRLLQPIGRNGSPAGTLLGLEIDEGGHVQAIYDTGFTRTLYKVPLVNVPNINGLEVRSDQTFQVSPASGAMFLWDAGDGPTGTIIGHTLEASATDVAAELTQLIQTQRAYSSNAKIIQTVDEMLQETANLKR